MKPIITLTTDLGESDYYLAAVKAKILSQIPDCHIIDISNSIDRFNIRKAAFVLQQVLHDFPKGSIHIISVGSDALDTTEHLIIKLEGHYLITANSGLLSLMTDRNPEYVGKVTPSKSLDLLIFPARDLYAPIAIHLAKGGSAETISSPFADLNRSIGWLATTGEGFIRGSVQYVDTYGNAITNIHKDLITSVGKGADFVIGFRQKGMDIKGISQRYSDVPPSERLALYNSSGLLEIAMNQGNASRLLGLKEQELVLISFYD